MEIYFVVPGEVVGKGRPRFTTRGGYARAITPAKTRSYEEKVKACYLAEVPFQPMQWGNKEPIEMVVNAYFEIPKSASKKAKLEMLMNGRPTKKPDLDNVLKAVADALNGVAYSDDSQIVRATITKYWSETPKAEIIIRDEERGLGNENDKRGRIF